MSKVSSANLRFAASISSSRTFADALARDAVARLLEHRARQVDAGHRAVARIERGVDAGADADLEHAIARLDAHPLDRVDAAGMQRRTEGEVVDRRELLVDARDEIVLDDGDRQARASRRRIRRSLRRRADGAARIRPSVASAAASKPANSLKTINTGPIGRTARATIHLDCQRSPSRTASAASMSPDCVDTWMPCTDAAQFRARSRGQSRCPRRRGLRAVGPPHPLEQRIRHADAGHLVGHELGVPRALEREDARRRPAAARARCASGTARTPRRRRSAA